MNLEHSNILLFIILRISLAESFEVIAIGEPNDIDWDFTFFPDTGQLMERNEDINERYVRLKPNPRLRVYKTSNKVVEFGIDLLKGKFRGPGWYGKNYASTKKATPTAFKIVYGKKNVGKGTGKGGSGVGKGTGKGGDSEQVPNKPSNQGKGSTKTPSQEVSSVVKEPTTESNKIVAKKGTPLLGPTAPIVAILEKTPVAVVQPFGKPPKRDNTLDPILVDTFRVGGTGFKGVENSSTMGTVNRKQEVKQISTSGGKTVKGKESGDIKMTGRGTIYESEKTISSSGTSATRKKQQEVVLSSVNAASKFKKPPKEKISMNAPSSKKWKNKKRREKVAIYSG